MVGAIRSGPGIGYGHRFRGSLTRMSGAFGGPQQDDAPKPISSRIFASGQRYQASQKAAVEHAEWTRSQPGFR